MAVKFRFRFEPVERVRKNKEQEALRGLGRAQSAVAEAHAYKNKLIDDMMRSLERRERLSEVEVGPAVYQIESIFIDGTKIRVKQAEQGILRAQRGLEKAMRVYLFAKRQLMIIEKLREKEFEVFRKARNIREQKQMDDNSIMRAGFAHRQEEEDL